MAGAGEVDGGRRRPSGRGGRAGSLRHIPALDGLRALAVLGVMADHAGIGFLQGGFLGVDAFFVLSGFLITSLLVSEWEVRGGIALSGFWVRRARRLLAGLFLMVLAVAVYVRFFAEPGTYPTLRLDALAAVFYVANWHFILSGQNYFNQVGPPSLLQHTWSLAIEEQFYIVWPLVVLALAKLRRSLWPLLAVSVAGALASAAEMALLFHPGQDTTRLYFGTDTQAQCLLVGAALACGLLLWSRRGEQAGEWGPGGTQSPYQAVTPRGRALLLGGGLLGLGVCGFTWTHLNGNDGTSFGGFLFRGGFLVSALAAALVVLAAVCFEKGPIARILSVGPLRYLGRISYGLYLWHFPIFQVVDNARVHLVGGELFAVRLVLTLAVSTASFHLVELPVRRGAVFTHWRAWLTAPAAVTASLVVLMVATAVPAVSASALTVAPARTAALKSSSGAPTRVLMVGDSTADTLSVGLQEVESNYDVDLLDGAILGCGVALGGPVRDHGILLPGPPACSADPSPGQKQWPEIWVQYLSSFHPNVVVLLAGRWEVTDRMWEGRWVSLGDPAFDTYVKNMLEWAVAVGTSQGAHMVLLTAPCYDSGEQPDGLPWPEDSPARLAIYNGLVREVAAEHPATVSLVDLDAMVCPGGQFQQTLGGVVVRTPDGVHFTSMGGEWLAPQLLPAIIDSALPPKTTSASSARTPRGKGR